ncbi:putative MFS monocarboxylate transporter [Thermoascus aurantiacus ATCC 26904]
MAADREMDEKTVVEPTNNNDNGNEGALSSESDPPSPEKKASDYQNGEQTFDTGFMPWLQVIGSFFLFFNSWGVINTFGVFQTYYEQEILSDKSPSTIAWIGSMQSFLLMLIGVVAGPLFDAGYFRALLIFGTLMLSFGLMMTSISTEYWHFMLAQGVCVGLASGCLFVPSVAILPQYFKKRRAFANGLAASGSSIGGVVYPIMFNQLQMKIGFPWATRVLGFVSLGTLCVSLSVLRMRFMPTEKRKLIQLSAFKELPYVLFCVALFLGFLGFYNFLVYVESYAIDTGIVDDNLGFYLVSMLNAASTFGRIVPNLLADYVGPLNIFLPAATVTAILAFCWIGIHNTPGIIILAILYGFFSGGFVSLPPVVMISLTKDMRSLGTRLGMCFSLSSVALLVGTPIGGAILNSTHKYLGVQLFTGCCLITTSAIMIFLRFLRTGPKIFVRT